MPDHVPSTTVDLRFAARWNGSHIGAHCVEVRPAADGGLTTVRTEIDLAVRIGLITVFRFRHESLEQWEGGRLHALASRTEERGSTYTVEGVLEEDGLTLRGPRGNGTAGRSLLTSNSLWNRAFTRQQQIIDAQWGHVVPLSWEAGERQQLAEGLDVDHYRFSSPDWQGSLWYDGATSLRASLSRNGHTITLERED